MPRHKKKKRAAAATAAGVRKTDWLVGDLVVAKLRGHRPWPAQIQKPEDYGYDPRPHRIFVTFFGTEETCFCSYNKITPFTPVVRKNLAEQLQKINTNPELERAIKEIFAADDEMKASSKAHGSSQKEDEEMVSEKSEEEEPPVEPRSRKRGRVVEETVAPPVPVVDERPAKMEKTVKSMAAEQVQKLPRKVRIKVSSQGSDLGSTQQQGGDRAGVSSSQARQSEPGDSLKIPVKNGDRTTAAGKVDDSVGKDSSVPKERGESIIVEVEETVRHDASENGGDTNKDSSAKEPPGKMEVEDEKSLASEATPEPPSGKEDADKPVVLKSSEHAIEKGVEKPVTSKTSEPAVENEEAEKPVVPKISEPALEKEETCDDVVEKMDVDDQKLTTTTRPATVEEESGKGDGPTHKEESTVDSSNEQQANQSSEAKAQEETHIVEDMDTGRAGQVEGVPPAAKEGVGDAPKSEPQSGVDSEMADDGLQNKSSPASTKQDAIDEEAPTKNPASVVSVSTKGEEEKEQNDGVLPQAQQVSTKDDVVSRTAVRDTPDPGQTPSDTPDLGRQIHGSEGDASRSNLQGGAVDQTGEDRDVLVKKAEDQNGTVKKAVNQDEDVNMTEDQEGAVKNAEDHDDGLKQTEGQGSESIQTEEHAAELRKTEEQDAIAELKKIVNDDAGAKKAEDQDIEVKMTVEHAAELKKTEEQDVTIELKKTEEQDVTAELKKTEEQDATAELKKIEKQDVGVKTKEDEEVAVKETDANDGALTVTEMFTEAKEDVEKVVVSTAPAARPECATPQIDIGGKAEVPTPVAKQEDTAATSAATGNGEVPSTGKQECDTAQLVEAEEKVEVSIGGAKQDAVDSKEQPAAAF